MLSLIIFIRYWIQQLFQLIRKWERKKFSCVLICDSFHNRCKKRRWSTSHFNYSWYGENRSLHYRSICYWCNPTVLFFVFFILLFSLYRNPSWKLEPSFIQSSICKKCKSPLKLFPLSMTDRSHLLDCLDDLTSDLNSILFIRYIIQ